MLGHATFVLNTRRQPVSRTIQKASYFLIRVGPATLLSLCVHHLLKTDNEPHHTVCLCFLVTNKRSNYLPHSKYFEMHFRLKSMDSDDLLHKKL